MKNLAITLGSIFLITLIITTCYVMMNTTARKEEIRTVTIESMEKALNNLKVEKYSDINTDKEFADYFVTYITQNLSSKTSSVEVRIYDISYSEGLIDAKVVLHYPTMIGVKTTSVRRTLIYDVSKKKLTGKQHVD